MTEKNRNIVHQNHKIKKNDRNQLLNHSSFVVWFTGLSGSGKSTLANLLEQKLHQEGKLTYILDGDNVRAGLNNDLGFSAEDRQENIRRVSEVSKLISDAGAIVLSAFISPFEKDRAYTRNLFKENEFVEIFVNCPVDVCEQRDVKGLYKKARAGQISDFTGISSPYETPNQPEIIVNTHLNTPEECITQILDHLKPKLENQAVEVSTN